MITFSGFQIIKKVMIQILSIYLINLQQLLNNPKKSQMRNDFTSNFTRFFLPLGQPDYSFLQLPTYRPMNLMLNEQNAILEKSGLQSNDGKGKWTFDQQRQYLIFLKQNMQEMRQKSSRKSNKVFLKMSHVVKTRTADQCRSHHQKVLKYHQSLEEIIRHYTQDVYSFEKIFGYIDAKESKQSNVKTGVQEQNFETPNIKLQGNTFKIIINADQINDY